MLFQRRRDRAIEQIPVREIAGPEDKNIVILMAGAKLPSAELLVLFIIAQHFSLLVSLVE